MASISLPVASYKHRGHPASTSRLVNAMAEPLPPDARTPFVVTRTPGIKSWTTVGPSGATIEGMHAAHGGLYVASGGGLYTVTSGAVATFRGAYGSSDEVDIDSSPTAVVIVSPPLAYAYTVSGATFAQITDSDFTSRGAGDVEFQGSRFLFREPDTGRFFGSDVNSATAYDALNFATAEGSPDALLGLKVDHEQVFLPGEKTCEFWRNTGGSGFPYERMENGIIELGCANGRTVAKGDNSLFFVASDYTVRRIEGFTPVRVSDFATEQWLRTVTLVSLRGWFFTLEGHLCYVLTAPEGARVFDITTQLWRELSTYGSEPVWNWGNPVEAFGKVLFGSTTSNVIAELSATVYTELTDTLRMEITWQPVYTEGHRAFHDRFEVAMATGVGLTSGQGSSPKALLSFSEDGGDTWFNLPDRDIGAIGKRETRVVWHGLGSCASAHGRVYRLAISDPVPVTIYDALLEVRGGRL